MFSPIALFPLRALASVRNAVMPAASGACAAIGFVPARSGRPRAEGSPASIMNFGSLGVLRCVCHHSGPRERRQFCRSCGFEVVTPDEALLSKKLSRREIKAMMRSLSRAANRAGNLELPATITNIHQLHRYLDGAEPKAMRFEADPASVERTQAR
jgi:hypothetical protein